jgi:hypothetical protein
MLTKNTISLFFFILVFFSFGYCLMFEGTMSTFIPTAITTTLVIMGSKNIAAVFQIIIKTLL